MTGVPSMHLWLIPILPFVGFLLNGLLGRKLPNPIISIIALLATGTPFVLVLNIAAHFSSLSLPYVERLGPWIQAGAFRADFAFSLDQLTLIMLLVVTGVGFLIHIYSIGYMAHEEGFWRFFAYLNLFMFFMLMLVLAENFLLVFVGWEGVGLASYLLIGFYFTRNSAANAGKKAFVVNRIGDFGFLLAMFLVIAHFGTLSFHEVFSQIAQHPELHGGFLTAIALCLVLGATGKSAQIPLYIWLPDAMEGPTPVSALIHAATMVTAGIYMTVRCHAIFDRSPLALSVVAIIGAATALFAATVGIVQTDIKRVLAYSTISQLGYMFMACGVAAYSAAIFHLLTHAFFKALLFLAAGSVIHALNGEQDMREMGGLKSKIPITFWTMTAGVVAISGIPPFAGFVSKDEILYRTFSSPGLGPILWFVGLFTAFLTSFYMFRLWYLTFFGERRTSHQGAHTPEPGHGADPLHSGHGVHESGGLMLFPLAVLAILSVSGGWVGWPDALGGGNWFGHFLDPVISAQHLSFEQVTVALNNGSSAAASSTPEGNKPLELALAAVSTVVALFGWFLAYVFYIRKPELPGKLAKQFSAVYGLVEHKYWVDEIYAALVVRPLNVFARIGLWWTVDRGLVDGAGYAAAGSAVGLGAIARRIHSGNIRSYAGWLAGGAAAILLLMYFGFGSHMFVWFAASK
ncbi:NADH-ubiquinone oxidoreductase chain L [Acidisarcina polymorpha]|uniref:NADH-ubiquinone oxidoreductase chain L n=1 Tax=Acidisarcina polymorpha TaxID=2211140 RepID=A0A2Z5G7Q6_9BACT|nr:NADH-quinone oxidoreductase subunit L [Acidisarcina polymorpha]AXC15091.1 NADH-ubiquinone oxidoreductase chain L [Acidisarcina polymorpha]